MAETDLYDKVGMPKFSFEEDAPGLEVCVINDVDLKISPQWISIDEQYLTQQWRTLRSNTSTPMVHGSTKRVIQMAIPFKNVHLLQLHRLLVEFRNSPFVYIENQYIRQQLVPEWNLFQNMMFTLRNATVSPAAGASDVWILQLQLSWFNYLPYNNNWLWRKEWMTKPVRSEDPVLGFVFNRYTIGWSYDDNGQKINRPAIIPPDAFTFDDPVVSWDLRRQGYANDAYKTVQEMEALHMGEVFDLLPIESNMEPSMFVRSPRNSAIYVRYINLLQRDALKNNFNIDVELDLLNHPSGDAFMPHFVGAKLANGDWQSIPLHESHGDLRIKWINGMLKHNAGVRFAYDNYTHIKLPQEWTDKGYAKYVAAFSSVEAGKILSQTNDDLTKHQRDNVGVIADVWSQKGIPGKAIVGGAANAMAESGLRSTGHNQRPVCIEKNGTYDCGPSEGWRSENQKQTTDPHNWPPTKIRKLVKEFGSKWNAGYVTDQQASRYAASIGLFQINDSAGAWGEKAGSIFDRMNPRFNADKITQDGSWPKFAAVYENTDDLQIITAAFAALIERHGHSRDSHLPGHDAPMYLETAATIADFVSNGLVSLDNFDHESRKRAEVHLPKVFPDLKDNVYGGTGRGPAAVDPTVQNAEEEAGTDTDNAVTEQDRLEMLLLMDSLHRQGWRYYNDSSYVTNVWKNIRTLEVLNYHADEKQDPTGFFYDHPVVLTHVIGSLSHSVSDIPIIGQTTPTHQFLGSVEPSFSLEFTMNDAVNDQGGPEDLQGIPKLGRYLSAMKNQLQHNARHFRQIPDSWGMIGDSFIFRLFGSYHENDLRIEHDGEDSVVDWLTYKRLHCTGSRASTIEGHPGVSKMIMTFQEGNPYRENESLRATESQTAITDEMIKKVLRGIYDFDFGLNFNDPLGQLIYLAQTASGNVTQPDEDNYGEIYMQIGLADSQWTVTNARAIYEGTADYIELSQTFQGFDGTENPDSLFEDFFGTLQIPLNDPAIQANILGIERLVAYEARGDGSHLVPPTNPNPIYLGVDFSALLEQNPSLGDLPLKQIFDMRNIIQGVLDTAQLMLSEEKQVFAVQDAAYNYGSIVGDAMTADEIREALYGFEITPMMWRAWLSYVYEYIRLVNRSGGLPEKQLLDSNSRPLWIGYTPITTSGNVSMSPAVVQEQAKQKAYAHDVSLTKAGLNLFQALISNPGSRAWNYVSSPFTSAAMNGSFEISALNSALAEIIDRYMRQFPLQTQIHETLAFYGYERVLGPLFSINENPTLTTQSGYFYQCLDTMGGWATDSTGSYAVWLWDRGSYLPGVNATSVQAGGAGGAVAGGLNTFGVAFGLLTEVVNTVGEGYKYVLGVEDAEGAYTLTPYNVRANQLGVATNAGLDYFVEYKEQIPGHVLSVGALDAAAYLSGNIQGQAAIGSGVIHEVSHAHEREKAAKLGDVLKQIAVDVIQNYPEILDALGLGKIYVDVSQATGRGEVAYPDLDLPHHPYYGDYYTTPPDFYLWNVYEDGGVTPAEVRERIGDGIDTILSRSFRSMRKLQHGREATSEGFNVYEETGQNDTRLNMVIRYNPEAHDGTPQTAQAQGDTAALGPTSFNFSLPDRNDPDKFPKELLAWEEKYKDHTRKVNQEKHSGGAHGIDISAELPMAHLPTADGASLNQGLQTLLIPDNVGGNQSTGYALQGSTRLTPEGYANLQAAMQDLLENQRQMFGSRAGFLGEALNESGSQVEAASEGLSWERVDTGPVFTESGLRKMADEAASTMIKYKLRGKRAYPTFKMFFVEEDEFEDRFVNFDDFYSYAAVNSFTYEEDIDSPVQVAYITLQNLSGILDGTKRNAVADFDRNGEPTEEVEFIDLQALRVRTGMNVQLRAGYDNDPNNLHVLLSGRITRINWNKAQDMCEVEVQSFGAELALHPKGLGNAGEEPIYRTTHHLLAAMITQPELAHFGRWEIGQLFQPEEIKDVTFDFTDYSREGHTGSFGFLNWATKWMYDHPILTFAAAFVGTGLSVVPGGGGKIGSLLSRFPVGRFVASRVFPAANTARLGVAGLTRAFTQTLASRSSGRLVLSATDSLSSGLIREVVRPRFRTIKESAENLVKRGYVKQEFADQLTRGFSAQVRLLSIEARRSGLTLSQVAERTDAIEAWAYSQIFKGRWFYNPAVVPMGGTQSFLSSLASSGSSTAVSALFQVGTVSSRALTRHAGFFIGAAAGAAAFDALYGAVGETLYKGVDYMRRFFAATKSRLMLSPQDDNLYPPHPKDYMTFQQPWWDLLDAGAVTAARWSGFLDAEQALKFTKLLKGQAFDKRVTPEDCVYAASNSTVWDVFQEMTLRHPGWFAYPRPYGTRFRYTMFFGIPSQRYWSKPGSTDFIKRVTALHDALKNDRISETEFLKLYGDKQLVEQAKKTAEQVFILNEQEEGRVVGVDSTGRPIIEARTEGEVEFERVEVEVPLIGVSLSRLKATDNRKEVTELEDTEVYNAMLDAQLLAPVMREYLRAIELRFTPFRRYHYVSSERDIISNQISLDEGAIANGVHVRYFPDGEDDTSKSQIASFKVHSSIPDHMMRWGTMPHFPNVRSYGMAMRYAMGYLMKSMSYMYRGELIILGDASIRVGDIIILDDSVNDMVGPIVVQRVTHMMSHQHGFVTSIKPGALTVGNEISQYPLLEAMKLWGMAMRDIYSKTVINSGNPHASRQERADAQAAEDSGLAQLYANHHNLIDFVTNYGNGIDNERLVARYNAIHGADGPNVSDVFSDTEAGAAAIPRAMFLDQTIEDIGFYSRVLGVPQAMLAVGVAGFLDSVSVLVDGKDGQTTIEQATMSSGGVASGTTFVSPEIPNPIANAAQGAYYTAQSALNTPGLAALVGSYIYLCTSGQQESVMVIPLSKNGQAMVAGLSYRDPTMTFKTIAGDIQNLASDFIQGAADSVDLYQRYGSALWEQLPQAIEEVRAGKVRLTP